MATERRVTVEQTKTMDLSPKKSQLKRREKQRGYTLSQNFSGVTQHRIQRNPFQKPFTVSHYNVRQPWPTKQPTTT